MRWWMAVVLAVAVAGPAEAAKKKKGRPRNQPKKEAGPDPGPFARGRSRVSLSGGSSGQFGNRYVSIGGGFGYFVAHGLELGLDAQVYFGAEPQLYAMSPQVRYIFWQVAPIRPYIGGFFQHLFIDGDVNGTEVPDVSSIGGRTGLMWATGNGHIGVGVAYEQILDCNKELYETCDEVYPEFGVGLSF